MRICVFGAGAIGGHLAARLVRGGAARVSVLARGAQLAAIAARGLRVHTADGIIEARPEASDAAAALGPQDAVVLCTKVTAYPQVARAIAPLLGPDTMVAFVANGIPWWYFAGHGDARVPEADPGDAMRDAVGLPRTLGSVVYSACSVLAPGEIEVTSRNSKLILGELDGVRSDRASALAGAFKAGGLPCSVAPDMRTEVWAKLVNNLSNGPICLLSRNHQAGSFADPAIRAAAVRCAEEGLAIAAALGRPLPGDGEARVAAFQSLAHKPSILQDLEAGRPMEFASLLEAPLRLAREAGVATPTLDLLVALARQGAGVSGGGSGQPVRGSSV